MGWGKLLWEGQLQKLPLESLCRADGFLCHTYLPAQLTKVKSPIRKLVSLPTKCGLMQAHVWFSEMFPMGHPTSVGRW